ncbi:RNA-binding protein [Oenococcus kitaharae]|uniref:RNA-binding S4 domain-containing protein n=1 Tax=Oenococcus kitaharae DSM 17330 TaxID=1045004 RepID=G9WH02_9LACO|nr:YlmH/Sll1252 family protein [Oenococcus kitaharae]EHN59410.1 hypothetical protein OKIT_1327 [Oenococcus kitaharae DSM 17330]OEY83286.1 cell division protein [Oenococcus kitaharae]OEY85084.1 cell division protein [Oenococcus kitaharae]OEY85939.1 cell division protein [Oenococcus kitaharae]
MTNFEINLDAYPESERPFIKKALGWVRAAFKDSFLTVFLNPREQLLLAGLAKQDALPIVFSGGYPQAENKRALIGAEDGKADFQIAVLQLDYAVKYIHLHHSTILGSLLHQGIAYDRIGDVIHEADRWQILIDAQLAEFVVENVKRAGSKKIAFHEVAASEMLAPESDEKEKEVIVASQRIDLLISQIYNFSRAHAKDLIESGQVMVNWFENDNPSYLAKLGDVISTHSFGRIRLIETRGTTNRNKIKLTIGIVGKN